VSACKRCQRPIVWGRSEHARNDQGALRWIAIDPKPHPLGFIELKGKAAIFAGNTHDPAVRRYLPHEVTCSNPIRPTYSRHQESHR
jgi:hypothetical protein